MVANQLIRQLDPNYNYVSNVREEEEERKEDEQPGVLWSLVSRAGNAVYSLWNGIVWFKDLFFGRDDATGQLDGLAFITSFEAKLQASGL
jgi:hypothetical protein